MSERERSAPCWFIPSASREQAEAFLRDQPIGAFLVRQSGQSALFALSCRAANGQVAHVRIEHCIVGSSDHWRVCEASHDDDGPRFDSLALLLRAQAAVRMDWALLNASVYNSFFGGGGNDDVSNRKEERSNASAVAGPAVSSSFTEEFRTWQIDSRDVKLLKRIGEGHFSTVWLARRFGEKVAVKQLRASVAPDRLQREFENEVKRMTTLPPHGNIVALLGITEFADTGRALVVQFCARGSLQDALYGASRIDFTLTQLVRVAREAACGVAHLHRHRVIHRDIAARNVLLAGSHDLVVKIGDFGMSRLLRDGAIEDTTRTKVGAVCWLAPEQLVEFGAFSMRSDVFAFGVLLFEIFARDRPWRQVEAREVGRRVLDGERMRVPELPNQRYADIERLMPECWRHEPAQRPTIFEIHDRLEATVVDSDDEDDYEGDGDEQKSQSQDGYATPEL
jgi:hypothetical protein